MLGVCSTSGQWMSNLRGAGIFSHLLGLQSLRRRRTTRRSTSCSWWATSERCCRSEASPQPTRRPPARSRRSRPLCRGRACVTVTLPYGAAGSSRRLPLLEAAGGGFLASPAARGVGLPSRHLEGSGRPVWGRSEGGQPPPAREFGAQPPSSPSPDRPRVCCLNADFELWGGVWSCWRRHLGAPMRGGHVPSAWRAPAGRPDRSRRAKASPRSPPRRVCMQSGDP